MYVTVLVGIENLKVCGNKKEKIEKKNFNKKNVQTFQYKLLSFRPKVIA